MKLPTTSAILRTLLLVTLAGCAPIPFGEQRESAGGEIRRPDQARTLVIVARGEPDTLADKEVLRVTGLSFRTLPRLFNAGLAINDAREVPQPYLSEALPQLGTDTWRVFPDGRMETTYRLRPGLSWHDGAPLTAEDFAFAWRVYASPDLGQAESSPISLMEEIAASDARTLVVRWRSSYAEADAITANNFQPLPRHLLAEVFQSESAEGFARQPFWTTGYVGLGPYRLERWPPGAFLEGTAFEGHVWGRPRIDRIKVLFISDFNTVLATMLAGEAHITVDDAIRFQQGLILKREWAPRNAGTVLTTPDQWRRTEIQHRVEFANPKAILDLRVRRALGHSIDKQGLNEALFEGEAILTDSFIPPTVDYYAALERSIARYPLDLRRTEQLMAEAGFRKGADGIYVSPTEGRFSAELKVNASAQAEAEMAVMASGWRQAGFELREVPVPPAQARIGEVRGSFPTLYTGGGNVGHRALNSFISDRIASPDNRWVGGNRSGWSNRDYDRLFEAFNNTLVRTERNQQIIEMVRIFTEQMAAFSLYFNPGIVAFVAALHGPQPHAPDADVGWNIHEWTWN